MVTVAVLYVLFGLGYVSFMLLRESFHSMLASMKFNDKLICDQPYLYWGLVISMLAVSFVLWPPLITIDVAMAAKRHL